MRPWTLLHSRTALRDRWIDVTADAVEDARGHRLDPFYTLAYPDWVQVVALTADDRLVLVRQYRHGLRGPSLELPAGGVDGDEEPLAAGARELMEETGHQAVEWRHVATLSPNTATHRNRCHSLLALGCRRVAEPAPGPGEDIAVELHPWREVLDRLHEGLLPQAMHVSALLLAARRLGWLTVKEETP
ncbi:NUDIX hydrolase [Roseomonas sp. OT10]|uniref:NUDIX hydrolase n=1 Tax=Roseomonas cutis TaxID=2897332 RepID=UPI001E3C6F10|nr:NUDIX hydrolase [Roseomonas sp. OT10]UFN51272.1 NUDIX hydrolase [Roseomonas sp. OT10]